MGSALWFSVAAFVLLYLMLLTARVRLEQQRAAVEQIYLQFEE